MSDIAKAYDYAKAFDFVRNNGDNVNIYGKIFLKMNNNNIYTIYLFKYMNKKNNIYF